jgi:hypothetical protein
MTVASGTTTGRAVLTLGMAGSLAVLAGSLICEYVDSSLGMGYGTTLTPVLMFVGFDPRDIVPAVLLSEMLAGLAAAVMHHREGNVDLIGDPVARRTAGLLSVLSVVGAVAAVTVAVNVPRAWLSAFIAAIVIAMGLVILATLEKRLSYRPRHVVLVGLIAAFNKGLSGGGYGPLVTGGQVVGGIDAKKAVGITSIAEGLTCAVAFGAWTVVCGAPLWSLTAPMALGAVLSVPMATMTVRRVGDETMRRGIGVISIGLGIVTVLKIVSG